MEEKIFSIHKPVLLKEVIESLDLQKKDIVFDGTLGGGGYCKEICKKISDGILIGTDLNQKAIKRAEENLSEIKCKKNFLNKNFSEIKNILEKLNLEKINKIVLDLGFSSDEIEQDKTGISFQNLEQNLDMNFSKTSQKITAAEILNEWQEESLADIFFYYGGERASKKIAKVVVEKRKEKKFQKVKDLVELLEEEIGFFYKNKKIHPATKVFQALRITVNDELGNLKKMLKDGVECLESGGIISVVSFHSLEDKIVKNFFKDFEKEKIGKRINKKVIKTSVEELKNNKRARSAKLRVFKKN